MADLRLLEFVLLRSRFEIRAAAEWLEHASPDSESPYPGDDLVALSSSADRDGDEFILRLDAALDDERLPFSVSASIGARFAILDEPELTADRAESTLVFMAFPYLRETISAITGRSPYPPYLLPPLTRLPDAPVRGDAPPIIVRDTGSEVEDAGPAATEDSPTGGDPPVTE